MARSCSRATTTGRRTRPSPGSQIFEPSGCSPWHSEETPSLSGETTVAEKEKIAARLGEAERELAETLAALKIERQKRQQAEAWTARLEEANRIARAALDFSKVEPHGPEAAAQVDTAPPQDDAQAANEDALALLSDEDREELSLMAADAGLSRQAMVAFLCQRAIAERRDRLTSRQQAGGAPAVDVAGMSP